MPDEFEHFLYDSHVPQGQLLSPVHVAGHRVEEVDPGAQDEAGLVTVLSGSRWVANTSFTACAFSQMKVS